MGFSIEAQECIERQFDAYCCKIIRLKLWKCLEEMRRKTEYEVSLEDMSALSESNEKLTAYDFYPFYCSVFQIPHWNMKIMVKDEQLAKAFMGLEPEKREIVLLYYFTGMRDHEIAELLHLVRRTVAYRRLSALSKMKSLMGNLEWTDE